MTSTYSPWWKRKILYYTSLYKQQLCGNFHWFQDQLCHCDIGCNGQVFPVVLRDTPVTRVISQIINMAELLREDIDCIHTYLDDINIPRHDEDGRCYSIVGRVLYIRDQT